MSNTNAKPTCPKPERLREIVQSFQEEGNELVDDSMQQDLVNALNWLATHLEDRALYHKHQQVKKKIVFALAKEKGLL